MPALLDGIPVNAYALGAIRQLRRQSLAETSRRTKDHGEVPVSVSYINDLERGTREVVSRERLQSLATALACDVRALTTEPHLFDVEAEAAA